MKREKREKKKKPFIISSLLIPCLLPIPISTHVPQLRLYNLLERGLCSPFLDLTCTKSLYRYPFFFLDDVLSDLGDLSYLRHLCSVNGLSVLLVPGTSRWLFLDRLTWRKRERKKKRRQRWVAGLNWARSLMTHQGVQMKIPWPSLYSTPPPFYS